MNYLDILRNAGTGDEVSFMSLATTGVKPTDRIISVFVGKETGPIASMACQGITAEELESTYKYHRISKHMYDNMIQVSPDVMYNSIMNFCSNDVLLTYNTKFARNMIGSLTGNPADMELIDICSICQWVRSGQIFNTPEDANLGTILLEMQRWSSSSRYGIKSVLADLTPDYLEDLTKPAPEAMVEALRCLCRFLGTQQVRISQAV